MSERPSELADQFRFDGRPRLVDQVTHVLREMILSNKIPAGTRLVQTDLAERLGVSRTPLREAIRVLEQDGLIRVSDGNGTVEVVSFSGDELLELYEIREVIDGLAASLLARRGLSPEADRELSAYLQTMSQSIMPLKGEAFFAAHTGFHSSILTHCGNSRLQGEMQLVRLTAASLRDSFPRHIGFGRRNVVDAKKNAQTAISEHEAIYLAIHRGDEEAAEKVARSHIRHSLDLIPNPADVAVAGGSIAAAGK